MLAQQPRLLIIQAGRPAAAAVVAAPILKLRDAYSVELRPACKRSCRITLVTAEQDNGKNLLAWNRKPLGDVLVTCPDSEVSVKCHMYAVKFSG